MKVLLAVSWGFGADTYDFREALVEADRSGRIKKVYRLPRLRYALFGADRRVDFGNGYQRADEFQDALAKRRIPECLWHRRAG